MEKGKIEKFCWGNHIDLMIVFGSQAKKSTRADSDFDLAVKLRKESDIDKLYLIYKLGELFDTDVLDLVILTFDMDAVLLKEIFMDGKLLYESASGLFEKERLRTWKIYLDTEKLRSYQKEYLKKILERQRMSSEVISKKLVSMSKYLLLSLFFIAICIYLFGAGNLFRLLP